MPLLATLFASLGRDPRAVRSPLLGRAAPPFLLRPVGGGPSVGLHDFQDRPLVVNFWSTWCGPCREEHATLLAGARRMSPAVQFVGIAYEDDEEQILEYLNRRGRAYPSLVDVQGRTAIAYGVFGVPETFFIDARGRVVAKHAGPLTPELLLRYVRQAEGGSL